MAPGWARRGADALAGLGTELEELHAATGAPVTMRRPWLQTWIDCFQQFDPLVVGVDGPVGRLDAVALLATRRELGFGRFVAVGHGPSDAVAMSARDESSARRLALTLRQELSSQPAPWGLALRHVVPGDLVLPRLSGVLANARLTEGDVSPVLRAVNGPSLRSYVSSSHHRGISRVRNRMVREGLAPQTAHVYDQQSIRALLPDVERVYRSRDRALGRRCLLDLPSHREFFRLVIDRHAEIGQVCLSTLHLDGRLAAYTLCFVDGEVYRMWNHRFDPTWGRLSPGKLAIDESVANALSRNCTAYDFMRGGEAYKNSYANERPVATDLYASSGRVVGAATVTYLGVRNGVRRLDEAGGKAARVAETARRLRPGWMQR